MMALKTEAMPWTMAIMTEKDVSGDGRMEREVRFEAGEIEKVKKGQIKRKS